MIAQHGLFMICECSPSINRRLQYFLGVLLEEVENVPLDILPAKMLDSVSIVP